VQGKIALEEHFAIDQTIEDSRVYAKPEAWAGLKSRLLDLEGQRLEEMDRWGTQCSILSLNSPAVQAVANTSEAVALALRSNDFLAETIARNPQRFGGFAALPMQDPAAAARELTRCVRELGFQGFLVNGFSNVSGGSGVVYYDDARYDAFWATAAELGKPFYMHPRDPMPSREPIYDGMPWLLGPTWAFSVETSIHALRLMSGGLFDRHPGLQMILGHLGEGLPFNIWRVDHILRKGRRGMTCHREIGDYLRENTFITTSGNFSTSTLLATMLEVGSDRILYSVDYPFEQHEIAATWFDKCPISEIDRRKIAYENTRRLFGMTI
jgi:2,3-dihydroxybenzoate decarboxylase